MNIMVVAGSVGTIAVLVVLVVIVAAALLSSKKHFQGEGGCCGGGGSVREKKKLENEKLGELVVRVDGMHCDNCRNRVEHAVNRLDGVACRVSLRKKQAVISYSREISYEEIKSVIEAEGYTVSRL